MLKIRSANEIDVPNLVPIQLEVHSKHLEFEPSRFVPVTTENFNQYFRELLDSTSSTVLLAEIDGRAVGYLVLTLRDRAKTIFTPGSYIAYIDQIAVTNSAQGKGVGSALLEQAKQLAAELGAQKLELDVWEFNRHAQDFFESKGFKTYNRKLVFTG